MTKRVKYNLTGLLAAALLIVLDQWTKHLAVLHLKDQIPFVLLEGVFELNYLENRGAAFGMFQGQRTVFLVCTLVILAVVAFYYNRLPEGRRFLPLRLVGTLLTAGAMNSFVVDFLYFKLIDFPVFNVADCYVTVGAALLAVLILFYYKEEELGFIKAPKEEKDGSEEKV